MFDMNVVDAYAVELESELAPVFDGLLGILYGISFAIGDDQNNLTIFFECQALTKNPPDGFAHRR